MADASVSHTPTAVRLCAEPGELEEGLAVFADVRPRLFGIAYRMLGRVAEVEDIVQDVWVRWQSTNRKTIAAPAAFLVTTTKRLCINLLQSAKSRRETYITGWLPEPVDAALGPGVAAEHKEGLQFAVLVLLQRLTPSERGAYVLREAFDYSYPQIAAILRMEEAHARQLVSRARRHVADSRRTTVCRKAQRRFLEAFVVAAQNGDMAALEELFAEGTVSSSNAGSTTRAAKTKVLATSKSRILSPPFPYTSDGRGACFSRHTWTARHALVA